MYRRFLPFNKTQWLKQLLLPAFLGAGTALAAQAPQQGPFLFHGVSLSQTQIAFATAGRIWTVGRDGGTASPLTDGMGNDRFPVFSPDGRQLAFARMNSGGGDVFVFSPGEKHARQLSFHPDQDWPLAWSPDGETLTFGSRRDLGQAARLYQIKVKGVFPKPLPIPFGSDATWSPDGSMLAYVPVSMRSEFRYYRGGLRARIHLLRLDASGNQEMAEWNQKMDVWDQNHTKPLTEASSNASNPMWIGNHLFFISDRDGTTNLYRTPINAGPAQQLTHFVGHGVRAAAAHDTVIVFSRDGHLYTMHANTDANTEQHHALALQVPLDFALKRQRRLNAMPWLQTVRLAPDGKSLIAAARGDLFHIDLDSGKGRNITQTSGIAERHPAIALDGTRLAYFSDKNGGYQLHTASVADGFPTAKLAIEKHPTFYQELQWSPPGRHLAFSDHRLRLWIMDLETGTSQQIDESTDSGQNSYAPAWSPDGRYLAYEKRLKNRLPAIFIFDTVSEQSHPITRGKIYARNPIFDPSGQYLYFVSSPNGAASDYGWSVLNGELQKPNYIGHLKAVILSEQDAPPFLPALRRPNLSIDWEHQARQQKIDWATIEQRILHVPLNHQGLYGIASAGPGRLFLKVREWPATPHFGTHARQALYRFDFRNPTALKKMAHAFRDLSVSKDGGTAIYQSERRWFLLRIEKGDAVHTPLALPSLPLVLTVEDEWRQIFAETSRYLGEHFYAPNYHGHDLDTLKAHYARYLPNLTSRADLTDLLKRMLGHTSVSHLGVGGGDPGQKRERVPRLGLLGADYQIENNRYRFKRIYRLGPYDIPDTTFYAPLDQPGNRVYEGEYLLAINGRPVEATHNLFTYFRNTAGQVIKLKVGPDSLDGPTRTVQVRPLANEHALHIADWAEANRRKVEGLSEGRLDYVHIASFNARGIGRFMQTYLQAGDHQGLIIDQRFNGGGITSDALIELLLRQPLYAYAFRRGDNLPVPVNAFAGAKVLLANQWCASAAETFALMFQLAKIGPIVGQPTMGAGIGPYAFNLRLIDGGGLRVPNRGAFHPDGHWGIENMGVAPDHSIAITPQDWRAGNDPQLAQAIQLALHNTPEGKIKFNRPAYPIHPGSNLVQPANAP